VLRNSIETGPLAKAEKDELIRQLNGNLFEVRLFGAADTTWDATGSIIPRFMNELNIPAINIKIQNIPGL
jgi:hypothetical protein